ncbi:hypothetical protein GCM10010507_37750 [Streptomyces cinnamoneus]|uniref:Uncharacterized protein n=1 Tax=Streptomyces cinnamoneus TaxID=53446 RepID=A0A918TQL5_STRCJ|nr:hypothetical protein GCM10010507_37750 [Streptomyces cinnamoneus]
MQSHGELEQRIQALSDDEALRALAVLVEDRGLLPSAVRLPVDLAELREAVDAGDAERYLDSCQPAVKDGKLA